MPLRGTLISKMCSMMLPKDRVARALGCAANETGKAPAAEYHEDDFEFEDIVEECESVLRRQAYEATRIADSREMTFPPANWERFHAAHNTARFFKERRYLPLAFPELVQEDPPIHVVELGCGCGASLVPVLKANATCRATACDVSPTAVALLREVVEAAGIASARVCAFAHDATAAPVEAAVSGPRLVGLCADICLLVFTLSAVQPDKMRGMLELARSTLRPGGLLLVRDYGLYDMTALRFPPEQRLADRLYHRSDGTLAYFFSCENLTERCESAGFVTEDVKYARVMLRNRKNGQTMRRVFVQGRFRNP